MSFAAVEEALAPHRLAVMGGFHTDERDGAPPGAGTLLLVGPAEPGFWAHVTAEPEFADGGAEPMDRWSARVLGAVAADLGATALFPFGGPPWPPFIAWALKSGHAWSSPVELLVHDGAGLFVSYRGALAFPGRLDLPPPGRRPCDSCEGQPCRAACPVGALTPAGYDVPACRAYLATPAGQDCMTRGCAVRRACPVSRSYGRLEAQSAFHMEAFAR
ncbi:ferredoxin [Oceaniglobus roseus]|uniref:ferredoxin n=1 Tax=Oceaniglobus roseus TaxID=1737570 RepID=UPI000C7E9841|nr:ferredoxin [Kandeliimicrobium roseum]